MSFPDPFVAAFKPAVAAGAGRENGASDLECSSRLEEHLGRKIRRRHVDQNRHHICFINGLSKLRRDFPQGYPTRSPDAIVDEILAAETSAART